MTATTARFADRIVLVTGAGSGIGRRSALDFAREGATVVAAGRTPQTLAATAKHIDAEGGNVDVVTADVSESADVARLVETVLSRHGRLDVALNNAGVFPPPALHADLDETDWHTTVAVNLTGAALCMKYQIRAMREHGGGAIVNISSNIGSHLRLPGMGAYAAAKAALSTLTRAAALDHIADGIRINAVSPGATDTAMTLLPGETPTQRHDRLGPAIPIGRIAGTDEVARAVLWLASEESSFVVGHDLVIDGGASA